MTTLAGVSVIIAVWDEYVKFLNDVIPSLTHQGCPIQIIVVDNASRLDVKVCENVDIVRLESRVSLGRARNTGLLKADHDIVCFCDADDIILPGVIGWLSTRLVQNEKMVSVGMGMWCWDPGRHCIRANRWPAPYARWFTRFPRWFAVINAFRHQFPMAGCSVHRRDIVLAVGGFSDIYPDDWSLANKLFARGSVELHPNRGRLYRKHEHSLDNAPRTVAREGFRHVRNELRADPCTPRATRILMPLIALSHCWHLRRYQKVA